jgi:predicted ATPase
MREQRYVITGPPGSGKTPVIRELATRGFGVVEEPARAVLAQQRAVQGDGVYDKDPQLLDVDAFTSDRRLPASRREQRAGVLRSRHPRPDRLCGAVRLDPSEVSEAAGKYRYSKLVFAFPSWPEIYTTDDERWMTVEKAASFGALVRRIYLAHGYTSSMFRATR